MLKCDTEASIVCCPKTREHVEKFLGNALHGVSRNNNNQSTKSETTANEQEAATSQLNRPADIVILDQNIDLDVENVSVCVCAFLSLKKKKKKEFKWSLCKHGHINMRVSYLRSHTM